MAAACDGTRDDIHLFCAGSATVPAGWTPEGPSMKDQDLVSLRTTELWASFPVDRAEPPEVEVTVRDASEPTISATVRVHRLVQMAAVRKALDEQHGLKDMRIAFRMNTGSYLVGCDNKKWLGARRTLVVPGLEKSLRRE